MCNGLLECSDGTDETNCMQCCDGAIIQMVHRCDGKFDCPDGSDEMYCHNLSIYIQTNIYYRTFLFIIFVLLVLILLFLAFFLVELAWVCIFLDCGPKEYFCLANHCVITAKNEGKLI